jgi:hypothetical protein
MGYSGLVKFDPIGFCGAFKDIPGVGGWVVDSFCREHFAAIFGRGKFAMKSKLTTKILCFVWISEWSRNVFFFHWPGTREPGICTGTSPWYHGMLPIQMAVYKYGVSGKSHVNRFLVSFPHVLDLLCFRSLPSFYHETWTSLGGRGDKSWGDRV